MATRIKRKYVLNKILIPQLIDDDTYKKVSTFVEWCFNFAQNQPRGGIYRNHILHTIAIHLLKNAGIYDTERAQKVLRDYVRVPRYVTELDDIEIPDIRDILGITHQVLLTIEKECFVSTCNHGTENIPFQISDYITSNIILNKNETLLDPCCGSGMFLCSLKCDDPTQLYGIDIDLTSCFITKINLLLKYKDIDFTPNIYHRDFLKSKKIPDTFDYIIVNPPYMDYARFKSKQSGRKELKYVPYQIPFLHKCKSYLKENGKLTLIANSRFLTSTSYLESRKDIVDNYTIYNAIQFAGFEYFRNTYIIALQMYRQSPIKNNKFDFVQYDLINNRNLVKLTINQSSFKLSKVYSFNFTDDSVSNLTKFLLNKGKYTLKDSKFIVGIATGNNNDTIITHKNRNHVSPKAYIPISTGKDLLPYKLLNPKSHVIRTIFEKTDKCSNPNSYVVNEKLVYRYICTHPIVAYDNSKRVFLNSLYGVVPNIPNMSIKTVMAFLNSRVFEFLYKSLFGINMIIKRNLLALTFPSITPTIDMYLTAQIDAILNTDITSEIRTYDERIQQCIYTLYELTEDQINIIENYIIKTKYTKTGTY